MNQPRPFLNRHILRKQLQIIDTYHSMNMKHIKPITSKLMEHTETVTINNTKRQKMKQVRESEIQRENKILLDKISSAKNKSSAYSMCKTINFRTRNNKSLNLSERRKQEQQIYQQNQRFVSILQQKKPTLNIQKLNKDWCDNKQVIKRLSNRQFYLTTFKSQEKNKRYSQPKDNVDKSTLQSSKINKIYTIDGYQMKIKAAFLGRFLKIRADCLYNGNKKEIQMSKQQALYFIQEECNGKMEELINKLKYDPLSDTLYIVSDSLAEVSDKDLQSYNPEIARKTDGFLDMKKKQKKSILKDTIERLKLQAGFETIAEQNIQYSQKNSKMKLSECKEKEQSSRIQKALQQQNVQEIQVKGLNQQKQHTRKSSHALDNVVNKQILLKSFQTSNPKENKRILIQPEQMEDYNEKIQNSDSKKAVEGYNK